MKRSGLKRLTCTDACGFSPWASVAQLERYPAAVCACGGRLVPDDLELAVAVLPAEVLALHPGFIEYQRQRGSVQHGQASHIQRGCQNLRNPEAVALERVQADQRAERAQRRLSGLVQFNQPAQALPF